MPQALFDLLGLSQIPFLARRLVCRITYRACIKIPEQPPRVSIWGVWKGIPQDPQKERGEGITHERDDLTEIAHDLQVTFVILVSVRDDDPRSGFPC